MSVDPNILGGLQVILQCQLFTTVEDYVCMYVCINVCIMFTIRLYALRYSLLLSREWKYFLYVCNVMLLWVVYCMCLRLNSVLTPYIHFYQGSDWRSVSGSVGVLQSEQSLCLHRCSPVEDLQYRCFCFITIVLIFSFLKTVKKKWWGFAKRKKASQVYLDI